MHYTTEVIIDRPREEVVALIDDPDNLSKWQPTFKSIKHISGDYGKPGAKSRLVYDMNGRDMEMVETILTHNLPDEMAMRFEAGGVDNTVVNRFEAVTDQQTRWSMDCEFQFTGWMRLMGWFMPGAFKKQTQADMERFKTFVEAQ